MRELIKLLESYIDFIQATSTEDEVIKETDAVIVKYQKLKRKYAVDL